ncbi:MAG: type VI secretion system contractile sheath large subunit, partial [Telluria sp.]
MAELQERMEQAGGTLELSDFGSLLQKEFKPQSDKAKESVENAVRTLAEQALLGSNVVSGDVLATIEGLISALDRKLSEQINLILHTPEFQAVEGAWRGLHHLVNNTETDEQLKIRVMNISKNELGKSLKKFKGTAWDQSPIFKKMYEEEFGQFGGEPFGAIVADYYFDNSAPDVELLSSMAKVAAAAHAPFISAAAPSVMLM